MRYKDLGAEQCNQLAIILASCFLSNISACLDIQGTDAVCSLWVPLVTPGCACLSPRQALLGAHCGHAMVKRAESAFER